ncbi:MAG: hypothetical protein EA425_07925 [Puniceicoccaceae bacterium]|nr:MAG: hypothetical protein EA425_07925 [Puniceicoccaceae bacterium]
MAPNFIHSPPAAIPFGFLNFAGHVRVSFFEQLPVHFQTFAAAPESVLWGTAPVFLANGSWQIGGNPSGFFDNNDHDSWNRGYPYPQSAGGTGQSINTYRTSQQYQPRARQTWLGGAIDFNYPVAWDTNTRTFRSAQAEKNDFVVLNIEHDIRYLSAERAEIRFGAQFDTLPQLNLANLVINGLTDSTGMAQVVADAITPGVQQLIHQSTATMTKLLSDNLNSYFEELLGSALNQAINQLYNQLDQSWSGGNWTTNPDVVLAQTFGYPNGTLRTQVLNRLGVLPAQLDQLDHLHDRIGDIRAGIQGLIGPNGVIQLLEPGNPQNNAIQINVVRNLARALIKELAGEFGANLAAAVGAGIDQELNQLMAPLLSEVEPGLRDIAGAFRNVDKVLGEIQDAIGTGGELRAELQQLFQDAFVGAGSELAQVADSARFALSVYLDQFGPGNNFKAVSADQVRNRIRKEFMDRFYGTAYKAKVQTAIKHRIFDVNILMHSLTDSVFGSVNTIVREVLAAAIAAIDDKVRGAVGDRLNASFAAAKVQGYAVFQDNALRKVRIDGEFRLMIPTDTRIEAFLEINQYQSDDQSPSCVPEGGLATEVTLGANNVPIDFITPGVRVNVATKLTFLSTNEAWKLFPVGMAGSFKMAEGEIGFEGFKITNLAAGLAFGATENYITAMLGMKFGNNYGALGGVFFGRTCTLDPIKLWDPLVADVLGSVPLTGMYVYGQGSVPLLPLLGLPDTCFFSVTVHFGAGFFLFLEGPTLGSKIMFGVTGTVLCVASVTGKVELVGLIKGSPDILSSSSNLELKLTGKGTVTGKFGICPLCVKKSKSVRFDGRVTSSGRIKGKVKV